MELKLFIPDNQKDLVITAYCVRQGYSETIVKEDTGEIIPNPETKIQFVRRCIIRQIKTEAMLYEKGIAESGVKYTPIDIT